MPTIPDFSLPGSDGRTWTAKDLAGKPAVIYFYPKDMTPGCTTEACDFRDNQAALKKLGVTVLGVSGDPLDSHARFIAKEKLNFPLLSDPDHKLAEALGAWGEKQNYGKTYFGIIRSTFLIDAKGAVVREWRKVKVEGHVAEVVAAARELPAKRA